jgi:hypothetical protein
MKTELALARSGRHAQRPRTDGISRRLMSLGFAGD